MIQNGVIRTTCGYCSVGCNIDVQIENGQPVKILPAKDYPVNQGRTCTKGFNLIKAYESNDRLLYPQLRQPDGSLKRLSWEEAGQTFVDRFRAIQAEHGPESVAFISTGQLPFEELALLGVFAKFGMGIRHGDGNTRQCMASAVVAYKQSFGFDAPPFTYADAEESDILIFVGANPVIAHPILWQRVKANQRQPKIVVVDPRRTETAAEAQLHLAIQPKSDLSLWYAIANQLIIQNQIDETFIANHVSGFAEFKVHVAGFSLERAAEETGLGLDQITALYDLVASGQRLSFWWTMGVNQSHQGVRTAQALIDICLITGNVGKPGTGPNSITGQCNAMGSRLFSNTTSLLGGHDFANPDHRRKVAAIVGVDEARIPVDSGMSYDQILDSLEAGTIKGLWIVCTNPAHSWIDKNRFFERMKNLDFLVVQDIYDSTETAQVADLLLPAAGSPEKEGTFVNSERRLGIVQQVRPAPGEAKSDFEIFRFLAQAWGCPEIVKRWTDPDAAFAMLREISRGQPCDISGIPNRAALLAAGGIQWPCAEAPPAADGPAAMPADFQHRRLFADGRFFHADGRAKLLFADVAPAPELPDGDFPLWLLTGRGTMHQWHTQTRTGKIEILRKMYPAEPYVEMNPSDAASLGVTEGQTVQVETRRGSVQVQARIKEGLQPGQIFLPMHYPQTNFLTYPAFDGYSRQPAYKMGAARVRLPST